MIAIYIRKNFGYRLLYINRYLLSRIELDFAEASDPELKSEEPTIEEFVAV
jgi:hypothetical protein